VDKLHLFQFFRQVTEFLFYYSRFILILSAVMTVQYLFVKLTKGDEKSSWFSMINKLGSPYKYLSYPVFAYITAWLGMSCIGIFILLYPAAILPKLAFTGFLMQFISLLFTVCFIGYICYGKMKKLVAGQNKKVKQV